MGYPIRTNRIKAEVDYDRIESVYDFYCIKTADKYFKQSAAVLDIGTDNINICSLKYETGNEFYVMLYKGLDNHEKLKNTLKQYDDFDKISFLEVSAKELKFAVLMQLLFNGLSWTDNEFLSFNNLTGRLYCFHTSDIKHHRDKEQDFIKQIKCLEIHIDNQLCIQLNVRTFTNIKFKGNLKFKKRKYEEYPQYVISSKNTLKRKTKNDSQADSFILCQFENVKTEMPFLRLNSIEAFNASKMGILAYVIELFNTKYKGIACIDFETIDSYIDIDHSKRMDKLYKERIAGVIQESNLRIVDKADSETSSILVTNIQTMFYEKYGIKIPLKKNFSKEGTNICVIHNKEWYEGQEDPHVVTDKYVVQHITLEDFMSKGDFAVNTVINELIIKKDIQKRYLSIFDWTSLNYLGDWIFGVKQEINDIPRYFFMTIHSDGSFEFSEKQLDLFSINDYNKYALVLEDKDVKGVVVNSQGQINIIKETSWFTIPQIEQIREHLQVGNNKLRSKEKEDELLYSCLDIKYMPINDKIAYYFVGTIGNGMQQKVEDACLIRKIENHEDSPLFFDELLPLLDITFVRNGRLTVVPFPFKFLREWINIG